MEKGNNTYKSAFKYEAVILVYIVPIKLRDRNMD